MDPKKNPPSGDPDRAKMMRTLIPAGAIALVVILVAVITSLSGGARKMSDGSDGSADDPGLKEVSAGVKTRDLKEGTGEPCPPGAKVKAHYTGWLTDGTVFDTSKDRQPLERTLSSDPETGVIQGWQEGIAGMKVGGIRKIVISPDKGYGSRGAPPKIPGGSTIIFEVELLGFTPPHPRRSPPPTDLNKMVDGSTPNAEDSELKSLGSEGLKYRDIKEGDGPEANAGDTVLVDYIGWLASNGRMFDSSWKPGREPLLAALGTPKSREALPVIKGWQQGMVGMKVGGIRKIVIPPALAYRDEPKGDIPPNSTLVFEVELLGIK